MSLASVRDLRVATAAGVQLLDGIDFSIEQGDTLGLIGASGAGKSVASRALLGIFPPRASVSGSVEVDSMDILASSPAELRALRRSTVAVVHQDSRLAVNPFQRIGRVLREARPRGQYAADRLRLERLVDRLGLGDLDVLCRRFPQELSGGMLQRVAIASALVREPQLVILDEATSALDVTTQAETMALIDDLQQERGFSVLMITHDLQLAAAVCRRVVVIDSGCSVEDGPAKQVVTNPQTRASRALIAATAPAEPPAVTPENTPAAPEQSPVVALKGVTRTYERQVRPALDNVSLVAEPGECLGIVGESGSGKSTLARIIVGLDLPTSGEVRVHGDTAPAGDRITAARRAQMVFQDPGTTLDPRIRARESVRRVVRLHRPHEKLEAVEQTVDQLLADVDFPPQLHSRRAHELSGGQRQRVAIARALAVNPELLVLDEATSALDVIVQAHLLDTITRLREHREITIVCVSHDLSVIARLCNRVVIMRAGKIVESGLTAEVLRDPKHPYTRALIDAVPRPGWKPRSLSTT